MFNFCDFIQVYVFTTNQHLNDYQIKVKVMVCIIIIILKWEKTHYVVHFC